MLSQKEYTDNSRRQNAKAIVSELFAIFRRANKIFNLCVEKYFPNFSKKILENAKKTHELRWKAYDEYEAGEKIFSCHIEIATSLLDSIEEMQSKPNENNNFKNDFLVLLRTKREAISESNFTSDSNEKFKKPVLGLQSYEKFKKPFHDLQNQLETTSDTINWKDVKLLLRKIISDATSLQQEFSKMKQDIFECKYEELDTTFNLYYSADDRNDDDIVIDMADLEKEQYIILNKIKSLLKSQVYDIDVRINFIPTMMRVFFHENMQHFSDQTLAEELASCHQHIKKWFKIGLGLIEQSIEVESLLHSKSTNKKNRSILQEYQKSYSGHAIQLNIKTLYSNLAICLADASNSDFQRLFAESYLELSELLDVDPLPGFEVNFILNLINPCTRAILAYKYNNFKDFILYLDEMTSFYFSKQQEIKHEAVPIYLKSLINLSCLAESISKKRLLVH